MNYKALISSKLVETYRTATTDQYGQISKYNFQIKSLFGDESEAVKAFAKENPNIITIGCYGCIGGCYYAVSSINDAEIKEVCNKALSLNKNYLYNINKY